MNSFQAHPLIRRAAVAIVALFATFPAAGAISHGPTLTNATAELQHRNTQFYDAEQSYEQKLQVGRERYAQKQAVRAKAIAAMQEEFRAREATVILHPVAEPPVNRTEQLLERSRTLPKALTIVSLLGFLYYQKRLKSKFKPSSVEIPYKPKRSGFLGLRPFRQKYRVTALKPVIILANMPGSKAKDKPAWIELKAGERRDSLGRVHGVHPDFIPRGRRIYMEGIDPDVVPLGAWNDTELPKNFYEHFRLELSE